MTRHIHADHIIAAAEDTTIQWQYKDGDEWWSCDFDGPSWSESYEYRQRPAPHPHQALMDIAAADPSIDWQYQSLADGCWYDCIPNMQQLWMAEYQYRQKPAEPKMVDLWQWAMRAGNGISISTSSWYYATKEDAEKSTGNRVVCRIEGSKITVPQVQL